MALIPTPPRPVPSWHIDEAPETPGPVRARVSNLQNQVSELVRKEHAVGVSVLSSLSSHCPSSVLIALDCRGNTDPNSRYWRIPSQPSRAKLQRPRRASTMRSRSSSDGERRARRIRRN